MAAFETCLENLVGVRCGGDSPLSGLFIEDLEGINIRTAANIADSGYKTGIELLRAKIAFATQRVKEDLIAAFYPYFRMNTAIDSIQVGIFQTNEYHSIGAIDRGAKFKVRRSRLARIRIKSVEICLEAPTYANYAWTMKIIDGNKTTNYPFTTDASGRATVLPDYLAETTEVYVVMNGSAIRPCKTKVKSGCFCSTKATEFISGSGWSGSGTSQSSYGMQIDAIAECMNDELICLINHKLGFPILYKTGIEIVSEWKASDRLNPTTMIEDGTEDYLLAKFEHEYKQSLKTLVKSLPAFMSRIDDICVVCDQSRYVEGTP